MKKMSLEEYKGVYVFAQQVDGEVSGIAYELLGKAKDLAKDLNAEVTAVLLGYGVKGLADSLAEYGADKVIVVDDKELEVYRTEPYAHALASVINEYKPEIMLVGATAIGRDLGPRVSARVATGLTADCTVLEIGDFTDNMTNVLHLVVIQSLRLHVHTTVHRWLPFVPVLCRRLTQLRVQKLK